MMKRNVEEEIKLAMGKRGWESNIKEMYLAFTSCLVFSNNRRMHNAVGAFSVGIRNFVEASHAKIITARDEQKGRTGKEI